MTLDLARAAGIRENEMVHVRRGALLHDIGKMAIPDAILLKPGPLTQEEWEIIRMHPKYASDLLSPIEYLRPAIDIPYCHHEWWNGSGYPRGLKDNQIPLAARVFSIIDVYDALEADRPYRDGWGKERTLAYIREQSGKQFDPALTDLFFQRVEHHAAREQKAE
jgi:HD-GYP domain-containing protein (c-di-GMP phosphodiesterase class II)